MMKLPHLLCVAALASAFSFLSCSNSKLEKDTDGNFVVNTTELGKDIQGFSSTVPLKVTISPEGAVVKVEALENKETPEYFFPASEKLLPKFVGKTSVEGIDAVSGATYSSRAIIENVKVALDYYQQNK